MPIIYPSWPVKISTGSTARDDQESITYRVEYKIFANSSFILAGGLFQSTATKKWHVMYKCKLSDTSFDNRYDAIDYLIRFAYSQELVRIRKDEALLNAQTAKWGFSASNSKYPEYIGKAESQVTTSTPGERKHYTMKNDNVRTDKQGHSYVGSVCIG